MNTKILGIPTIIIAFVLAIVVPILFGIFILYKSLEDVKVYTEEVCKGQIVAVEPVVTPTVEPTATPSPVLKRVVPTAVPTQPK